MNLRTISRDLADAVDALTFAPPVTHVMNPLIYARAAHEQYLAKWARPRPEALLLGMNPGPFGMMQTGVPFGEVEVVRDWLGIDEPIDEPRGQHPQRPIQGWTCTRSEVSGRRLWGWARRRFVEPSRFFARFFVANYCPLVFLTASGSNRTPDRLPRNEREPLEAACDEALRRLVTTLAPGTVIGVGGFARKRAETALTGLDLEIATILHPSPASPAANRGWEAQIERQLAALGIKL